MIDFLPSLPSSVLLIFLRQQRSSFGLRWFVAYTGISFLTGALVFELAEIIRWLQKFYERFDL